jgi:hypothetical protein
MLARSFDEGGRSGGVVPKMKYSLTFRKGVIDGDRGLI